jgi:hypothetical protein
MPRRLSGRKVCRTPLEEPVISDGAEKEAVGAGTMQQYYRDGPGQQDADSKILAIRHGLHRMRLDYLKKLYFGARRSPECGQGKNDRDREAQTDRVTGIIHRSTNRRDRPVDRSISEREVEGHEPNTCSQSPHTHH